jgi:hypothetical protein
MASSGMLRRVALVRTDVPQKTPFFIVTAVKTSNLTYFIIAQVAGLQVKGKAIIINFHFV